MNHPTSATSPAAPATTANPRPDGAQGQQCDEPLARAKKLFGDEIGYVGLADEHIPRILKDDLQKLKITEQNEFLAVPCGASSNLAAVVLPFTTDLKEFNQFTALNPMLRRSLITSWDSIAFLWVRVEGWRPANRALPGMLWIASGLLPTIVERVTAATAAGPNYFQKNNGSIVTIKFADLKWPPETHEGFLLERLESQHGPIILRTGPRKQIFNVQTSAHFLAAAIGIIYDRNTNQFFMRPPAEPKLEPLIKVKLHNLVSIFFQKRAARCPSPFSIANSQVTAVIAVLKTICAVVRPDEREGLMDYLARRLERRQGANLTSTEIYEDYISRLLKYG
jgi:hypothetical protein